MEQSLEMDWNHLTSNSTENTDLGTVSVSFNNIKSILNQFGQKPK